MGCGIDGKKLMLEKHIRDIIEQILIEIWFQCPLSTWLMGPPPRRLRQERVFNMTIKYLSLGCTRPPPQPLHQYSVAFVQIKLRLNFLYFPALTYVLWQALNQFYAIIDFFLNGHKPLRLLPFFSTFLPVLPHCTLDIRPAQEISHISPDFRRSCPFTPFLQHQNWRT